jgi:hypothetical protein
MPEFKAACDGAAGVPTAHLLISPLDQTRIERQHKFTLCVVTPETAVNFKIKKCHSESAV